MHNNNRFHSRLFTLLFTMTALIANAYGADSAAENSGANWNLIVPIFVVIVCASVVYLCYQAMLAWSDHWKAMALAPLFILGVWLGVIIVAKIADANSHELWAFEVFAWAMATTIYLVVLMTAKRTFEKAAKQNISE